MQKSTHLPVQNEKLFLMKFKQSVGLSAVYFITFNGSLLIALDEKGSQ